MTSPLPFTEASLARAIKGVERAGRHVVGVRSGILLIGGGEVACQEKREYVYFISCGEFVKIGYSTDWGRRFNDLQASNPHTLSILAVFDGTREDERSLHKKFAAYRIRPNNEWFFLRDEITAYLEARKTRRVDI